VSPQKYCGETLAPEGYVSFKRDCCDSDAQAKPGQTVYFPTANTCGSFDYDCDAFIGKQFAFPAQTTCDLEAHSCTVDRTGFAALTACGATGLWVESCLYSPFSATGPGCLSKGIGGHTQRCR
jgi:hypothetical protein